MNQGGRILLLGTAVVLLIVGVVCLKQRLGDGHSPTTTYISAESSPAPQISTPHQPQILSTDASNGGPGPVVSPWHEATVLPVDDEQPQPRPTFPNYSDFSPSSESVPDSQRALEESEPTQLPPLEDSTNFAPVPEMNIAPTPEAAAEPIPPAQNIAPLFVITNKDDSLWSISEKVYGVGGYYQALFAVNRERIVRPDRIEGGIELSTPPAEQLRELYPDLTPGERGT